MGFLSEWRARARWGNKSTRRSAYRPSFVRPRLQSLARAHPLCGRMMQPSQGARVWNADSRHLGSVPGHDGRPEAGGARRHEIDSLRSRATMSVGRIRRSSVVRVVKKGEVTTAPPRRDGPHTPAGAPGPSDKTTHASSSANECDAKAAELFPNREVEKFGLGWKPSWLNAQEQSRRTPCRAQFKYCSSSNVTEGNSERARAPEKTEKAQLNALASYLRYVTRARSLTSWARARRVCDQRWRLPTARWTGARAASQQSLTPCSCSPHRQTLKKQMHGCNLS